ncbi:MAG: NAD(+) synthase [Gemmataceae bacterium]|nr:NAD(+) synthase [Gemmataceae bacterium]
MISHGFLRVAAAVPTLRVADCAFNAERILALMTRAEAEGVSVLVFPELAITGYTCADLFHQITLQHGARDALLHLARAGKSVFSGVAIVGLPFAVNDQLFNCAAVLHQGSILGLVPKTFLPNYKEFYEVRWFAPASAGGDTVVSVGDQRVPFGTAQLFDATDVEGLVLGVEICEDLWVPIPPSCHLAMQGATLLVNLSASNEVIGKTPYRRQLVLNQSGRCMAAYVYTSCGVHESTTDLVFGGHCLIAENGSLLAESPRFRRDETLLVADVDIDRLRVERQRTNSFQDLHRFVDKPVARRSFALNRTDLPEPLRREVEAHPFVPRGQEQLRERCDEIFHTQVAGLAKRLEHIGKPAVAIGVSGGLDSTLALLVACKTMDAIEVPRDRIRAFTMPGFGTTTRTRRNAWALMEQLGVTAAEVDIRPLCLEEMRALKHRPFGIELQGLNVDGLTTRLQMVPDEQRQDLVFENVQARMRTSILMNSAFVIGTGDVSELALGWATYNGDHMSMYNPNVSIPKTLVKFLVHWAAMNEFDGEARRILLDVVATKISPELLPAGGDGQIVQETEETIGPYELHDFFLFHFLRYGAPPEKILFLAEHAKFDRAYTTAELRRWLRVFVQRFFANQFKRSCLPDGPKVGSISLSPRGDWRMPSDAQGTLWLQWANEGK